MPKKYENIKGYNSPLYALTTNRLVVTLGPLKSEINCDVCVVGGGFTGISAALELAQKGLSVVLLEAKELAAAASGRNGGHVLRGFAKSPGAMIEKFGLSDAKLMNNLTLEGLALILERIARHEIKCDLKFGHVTAALNKKQEEALKAEIDEWAKIGHDDMEFLRPQRVELLVRGEGYMGGLFDPKGAHLHPVNYALGIAQAAQKAGCKIYDQSPAIEIVQGSAPEVVTATGRVKAKFVILAGAAPTRVSGAGNARKSIIMATAHMIATEPLTEKHAQQIIPGDVAVTDARFIMNYYRLSADRRLLFGGDCRYGNANMDRDGDDEHLRARMVKTFPSLKNTRIDHCWGGPLDFTFDRLPHVGRVGPQVYFAQGFCGHGIIATNILGKVLAEAVTGTAARFDVFTRIKHPPIGLVGRPLFVLGSLWYAMKDKLF